MSRLQKKKYLPQENITGLLSLRRDRGDRSIQWLRALEKETFPELRRLYLYGEHAPFVESRLRNNIQASTHVLRMSDPERIMETIIARTRESGVLTGMGNMAGIGEKMVAHWSRIGEPA
jgi:hypothetical protein